MIVDPLYRLIPKGGDENNNVAMAHVFADLLQVAEILQAGLLVVHHLAKGDQSGKSVTDLGAGAGAQSRACDTHLALREHAEDDAVVLAGVTRSWAPFDPFCLRWQYPSWVPAEDLDPSDLRKPPAKRTRKAQAEPSGPTEPVVAWTADRFADHFIEPNPQSRDAIVAKAVTAGINQNLAGKLLGLAEGARLAFRWKRDGDRRVYFASQEQPLRTVDVG